MTNKESRPHTDGIAPLEGAEQNRRQFVGSVMKTMTSAAALTTFGVQNVFAKKTPPHAALKFIARGDENYERARINAVWNSRAPTRYPDKIAYIKTAADAVEAIQEAKKNGWKVTVRGGGHNWIGSHLRDGALLLDLSRMTKFEIDTHKKVATVEPGVRARDFQKALNDKGLRFPTATCPDVGVSGHIIGGGTSFTTRLDGVTCNLIEAVDVVLADGKLIHATDKTHPEVMWAVRGSGVNFFGVVTKFYLKLKPLPKSMLSNFYIFSNEQAAEFLAWMKDVGPTLPPTVQHNWFAVKILMPDYPGSPIGYNAIAFGDTDDEARAQLDVIEKSPLFAKAMVHQPPLPWTFDTGFTLIDKLYPRSFRFRAECLWVDPHQDGFAELLTEAFKSLPNLHSHILGAPSDTEKAGGNSCFGVYGKLSLHFYGVSPDAADDQKMSDWVNGWMGKFRKYSPYNGIGKVNDNGLTEFPKYILSPENTDKLQVLRTKYDPTGVFLPGIGTPRSPALAAN